MNFQGDARNTYRQSVALTRRQAEVLEMLLEGKTIPRIAAELFVAESTVISHLRALHQLFGVKNRMALCRAALVFGYGSLTTSRQSA